MLSFEKDSFAVSFIHLELWECKEDYWRWEKTRHRMVNVIMCSLECGWLASEESQKEDYTGLSKVC